MSVLYQKINDFILVHPEVRQEHKIQTITEHTKHTDTVRWIAIALILILALIGLYFYFTYYNTGVSHPPHMGSKSTRVPKTSGSKAAKGTKGTKQTKDHVHPKKESTNKKSDKSSASTKQASPTNKSPQKPKTRILRRAYAGSDPDKPYLVDIINGDNLLEAGEYTMALETFNSVIKKFPQSVRGLYGKAMALSQMAKEKKSNKLMDTAIEFYKKAGIESFVGNEEVRVAALVELSDRAYERGKPGLSIKALEKLVELREDNVLFSNRLGLGYIADGKTKKAKAHFKKHIEKFPDDHFGKAQLGYVFYSEKRYEQALPLLLDGIRNDEGVKQNPKFYRYAGESLTKLNRSDEVR